MTELNPLDVRLGDYIESLTDRNWHTLALLILMERNQLTEDHARELLSVYLTARNKYHAIQERTIEEKTKHTA
jgi:hypothetical protein